MNRQGQRQRRLPPGILWFIPGLIALTALAVAALGVLVWQASRQAQTLRTELQAVQGEHKAAESRLLVLQSTVDQLETRVAALEANDPTQQLAGLQAATGDTQLTDLEASLAAIEPTVKDLQGSVDGLAARLGSLEAGLALPPEVRLQVGRQKQSHRLSCESSAASMVARYHGVNLSEAEVLDALPLNDNPHLGFRGNVDGPTGGIQDYGVYAGPIRSVLNSRGLRAWLLEGGLEGIKAAIARGNPVIAWVTFDCQPGTPQTLMIGGEPVTVVPYQHVVVVTGYDSDGVWANDPWDGREDYYPAADFARAMGYFGDMAIEVAAP